MKKKVIGATTPVVIEAKKEEASPVLTAKTTGQTYLDQAKGLIIEGEEAYSQATEILSSVKNAAALAELEKNKVLIPAKQVVKAEEARWKPIEQLFKEINEVLRPKMNKYITDKENKAKEDLQKLQSQIASGHIKKEETIARKEDEIYSSVPAKTVYSGSGSSSVRKVAKLKITNPDLVPDKYWVIDEVALRKDVVTNDLVVPGAEKVYENSIAII